jgi:hypothetical protein
MKPLGLPIGFQEHAFLNRDADGFRALRRRVAGPVCAGRKPVAALPGSPRQANRIAGEFATETWFSGPSVDESG